MCKWIFITADRFNFEPNSMQTHAHELIQVYCCEVFRYDSCVLSVAGQQELALWEPHLRQLAAAAESHAPAPISGISSSSSCGAQD